MSDPKLRIHRLHNAMRELVLVESRAYIDQRGTFEETFTTEGFLALGLPTKFAQDNISRSHKHVIRGLHLQTHKPQGKLVRCMAGKIYDVAVDLRPGSFTYGLWAGVELSEDMPCAIYIPPGFAHGFAVLSPYTSVHYKCTTRYHEASSTGIRFDDPDLCIPWPTWEPIVSDRDKALPLLKDYR